MGDETQTQTPVSVPDINRTVPQADPAQATGPDSHNMGRLSDRTGSAQQGVDWEARYNGMNAAYQRDIAELKKTVADLAASMQKPAAAPQQPVAQPAPVSAALQNVEAQLYRDRLLDLFTQKGEPGEGLPLHLFKANIPVMAPKVGADGKLDDSEQRAAIAAFVNALKGVQTSTVAETRQVLTQGTTPGAPGAKPPATMSEGDQKYEEFKNLMLEMAKASFVDQPADVQAAKTKRYYELLRDSAIEARHGGATQPAMDWGKLSSQVQRLTHEVESLRSRGS